MKIEKANEVSLFVHLICWFIVVTSWQIQWDGAVDSYFIVLSAMKTKEDNACCLGTKEFFDLKYIKYVV